MILYGKAIPGVRDDVLEDACRVSLRTGAQIELDFNGVKCVVHGFLGRDVETQGIAIFMSGESFERIERPGMRPLWKLIPKTANATAALAEEQRGT